MSPIFHQRDDNDDDPDSSRKRSGSLTLRAKLANLYSLDDDVNQSGLTSGAGHLTSKAVERSTRPLVAEDDRPRTSEERSSRNLEDIDAFRIGGKNGSSQLSESGDDETGTTAAGMDEVDAFLLAEDSLDSKTLSGHPSQYALTTPPRPRIGSASPTDLIDRETPRKASFAVPILPFDKTARGETNGLHRERDTTTESDSSLPAFATEASYPPSHSAQHSLSHRKVLFDLSTHSSSMSLDLAKRLKEIVTKPFNTPEKTLEYSPKLHREPMEMDGLVAGNALLAPDTPTNAGKSGYRDDDVMGGHQLESPGEAETYVLPLTPTRRGVRTAQILLAGQATPSLLLSLVGLIFTGQLIDHLARWQVFKQVDELFILVPIIGNLKGNLEMCLASRLSTFAAQGLLDTPKLRHAIITKSLLSLQLQALSIASLAGFLSFSLGFFIDTAEKATGEALPETDDGDAGLPEYSSTPGGRELVLMLATAMIAASLTSAILGGFMSWLIVACRWMGVDPDNVASPLAACLGDLLTVFVLALIGTVLAQHYRFGLPIIGLIAAILATVLIGLLVRRLHRGSDTRTYKNEPADQEQLGWSPLIVAMFLSCGTGLVLDASVNKYKGFALMGLTMTGVAGSIGAIHGSRLSTTLHSARHEAAPMLEDADGARGEPVALSARRAASVLFLTAWPVQLVFIVFTSISGWLYIDLRLLITFLVVYALTVIWSIFSAHVMTEYFWSRDLDPDSYTLPIHSALVDVIGQILLVVAFESAAAMGADVKTSQT